jgi:hypothetical protein
MALKRQKIAIFGYLRAIFDLLSGRFNPKTQYIRDQHNFSCESKSKSHFVPHNKKKVLFSELAFQHKCFSYIEECLCKFSKCSSVLLEYFSRFEVT